MERAELLMREYETITAQIIHWDTFFWSKSQFFLAIQSVLLAVVGQRLGTELTDNMVMHSDLFSLLVGVTVFNLFLCYAWFRTNRSNQEYLAVRFMRALQIEKEPEFIETVQLYHLQLNTLKSPAYAKHSSSLWEIHLPSAFIIAWLLTLVAATFDTDSTIQAIKTGVAISLTIAIIAFIEITGWPSVGRKWPSPIHTKMSPSSDRLLITGQVQRKLPHSRSRKI